MLKILKWPLIILALLTVSCGKKVFYNPEELVWFETYKIHDTLIFQNVETSQRDTTIIISRKLSHAGYDWWIHGKYKPHCCYMKYFNKSVKHTDVLHEGYLFSMCKDTPEPVVGMFITYLNSSFGIPKKDLHYGDTLTLALSKRYCKNVQKLDSHGITYDNNPQTLYWGQNIGIIKYVRKDGSIWERINW